MKVYYVTEVLRQVINIKTMCPYYTLEFRNMTSYLLQVPRYNCHQKSCLLNCWSLLLYISSAIIIQIV